MKIQHLDKDQVLQAARKQFPDYEISVDLTDFFTYDLEEGHYKASFLNQDMFVSTGYAYEDVVVNGNDTRYKIQLTTIMLLKNAYEILYQTKGRYYVAYEEDGIISFQLYEDFFPFVRDQIERVVS